MKSNVKRKNMYLDENKIEEVRKAFGAKNQTEAIIIALDTALRFKKLQNWKKSFGKVKFNLTQLKLREMRSE